MEVLEVCSDRFQPFRTDSYISSATYSRLLLQQFFDDRWDRLLYLDADLRVMVPLQPFSKATSVVGLWAQYTIT